MAKSQNLVTKTPPKKINVAVVGATGIVGQEFIKILEETKFPVDTLKLFASEKSAGEEIKFQSQKIKVEILKPGCFKGVHCAFFSAGNPISREWGPRAVSEGAFVIDNSSAFRMDKNTSLIIPEVNGDLIPKDLSKPQLIANPNCSTIQLVVALEPLHNSFGLKNVTVATYQSVSGAGREGIEELRNQTKAFLQNEREIPPVTFSHSIAFNNIPQIDKFDESGFTLEELKVMNETKKIMNLPHLDISTTAVRTPTLNSHSEAVWIEIEKIVDRAEIIDCLKNAPGITIQDDPKNQIYPLARSASGLDDVFIGRIRRDITNQKRWLFWVVSDNVRKGAALNGIQIAQCLFRVAR